MRGYEISLDQLKHDPAREGALDPHGQLRIHPLAFWQQFSQLEIGYFCVTQGHYCIPTQELIDWLRTAIGGRKAIEVGAGQGALGRALSIPTTDNKMQLRPEIAALYQSYGQEIIRYGNDVRQLDAESAVQHFMPKVVVAAWLTHRYNPDEHWREGNQYGPREERIIRKVDYIFIGNRGVHRHKPILSLPHESYEFPWLLSRAVSGEPNFIAVWKRSRV